MLRVARSIALLLAIPVATAQAANVTVNFAGTVRSIIDANDAEAPPIDFQPAPVGSSFSGTITYDDGSAVTDGGTGYARYLNLLSSSGSLTINGHTIVTNGPATATTVSGESGFGFSGINLGNQPVTLPAGWSVSANPLPYFTLQLWDVPPRTRPLTLPSSQDDFATDHLNLVLDFQQSVTVAGQAYGGRVFLEGTITSLSVIGPPPPPREVAIDVIPTSQNNEINLKDKKPKPLDVAVFGSADFDVTAVVPETIILGDPELTDPETGPGQKVAPSDVYELDVNRDGRLDLLLRFDLRDLKDFGAIGSSSTSLEFQALLDNQGLVFGSDDVSISGGKGKGRKSKHRPSRHDFQLRGR